MNIIKLHKESKKTLITNQWQPSDDVKRILDHAEIDRAFVDDALPEFILYWKDNGAALKTWNVKFVDFVKRKEIGSYNSKNEPGKFTKTFKERKSDQSWAEEIE